MRVKPILSKVAIEFHEVAAVTAGTAKTICV